MTFQEFCKFLLKLEQISSRNLLTEELSSFYTNLEPDDIYPAFYMLQGRLAPKFEAVEYNFSEKLMLKSLTAKLGNEITNRFKQLGDMGDLVFELKESNKSISEDTFFQASISPNASLGEVFAQLKELATLSGKGSQDAKVQSYFQLINSIDSASAKFLTRIILGDLRLGISEKTILDSLSWFLSGSKQFREVINYAFGINSDISLLAEKIFEFRKLELSTDEIFSRLQKLNPTLGIPLASKLVERESSPEAIWKRMPNCLMQPKLDGLRGQLHFDGQKTYIFSRNLESLTDQFPEITAEMKKIGVGSIILDSEIISYDTKTDSFGTYQATMQRRRKYDIDKFVEDSPVCAMCFDIMFLDGENLLNKTSLRRFEILKALFERIGENSILKLLETKQAASLEELNEFFYTSIDKGLEGIITKAQDSVYEPGTRNYQWIKLKYNAMSDRVDTIDVVVMGYYAGSGSRAEFGFGALLCGVVGEDDQIYCFAKVGSGFSEELMRTLYPILQDCSISNPSSEYVFNKAIKPDVWVAPKVIIEVDADEITRSPLYSVGIGIGTSVKNDDLSKGLSLRFPRIKRIRPDRDKPNSVNEVLRMYELRKG